MSEHNLFQTARTEIAAGRANAHALWVLLTGETDRDEFALKPLAWEGAGEYQRVSFDDGRDGFVKVDLGARPLHIAKASA